MTAKLSYLPIFFGDFLASTAEWTGEEQGLYLLLLGHQWSLGSLPTDPDKVRLISKYSPKAFKSAWSTVSAKFVERDGRLINTRLEEHRTKAIELANKRANAGRKGAESKWQMDDKPMANATTNASGLPCHPILSSPISQNKTLRSSSEVALATSSSSPVSDGLKNREELRRAVAGIGKFPA